ncbi:hypothetical protein [Streptomyces sp. NPDC058155]|uniref:hypothetical protein n=1 Tax=Streptomyces sp. NPDC058155 TaxID=3346359 RepID=UPI0036E251ED
MPHPKPARARAVCPRAYGPPHHHRHGPPSRRTAYHHRHTAYRRTVRHPVAAHRVPGLRNAHSTTT